VKPLDYIAYKYQGYMPCGIGQEGHINLNTLRITPLDDVTYQISKLLGLVAFDKTIFLDFFNPRGII